MKDVITAVYLKNYRISRRAYPWSFMIQRIVAGIFSTCFPLFIYYFIFKGNMSGKFYEYTNTSDYVSYIVLGNSVYILAFATLMNVGRCIISEIREGTFDSFLLSPASRWGYFVGAYLEQFLRSMVEFFVVLTVGIFFGARFSMAKLFVMFLIVLLISLSCFSMAILVSTIMVFTRDTYLTQNTIITLIALVSGIYFPSELLPKGIQILSYILPITHGLKVFRNCVLANGTLIENGCRILVMCMISAVYLFLGLYFLKKIEKKLVEEILA